MCLLKITTAFVASCATTSLAHPTKRSTSGKFLVLSDFHLDPYYGGSNGLAPCNQNSPQFGTFSCDSPMKLVHRTLQEAQKTIANPDFVLVLGDYVRHYAHTMPKGETDTLQAMKSVSDAIEQYFPTAAHVHGIENLLGNDDLTDDYVLPLDNTKWLASVSQTVWPTAMDPTDGARFKKGGFYRHYVSSTLAIISLNTIPYSVHHKPHSTDADPFGQFAWLTAQLSDLKSKGHRAYIIGHIPPALDASQQPNWEDKYAKTYYSILAAHPNVVAAQFFGHLHRDTFRTYRTTGGLGGLSTPMFLVGSVSPIYHNNPSYRVVSYDAQSNPTDYSVHVLDVVQLAANANTPAILEYTATQHYGISSLSNAAFRSLAVGFMTDDKSWEAYREVERAGVKQGPCTGTCRAQEVCSLIHVLEADYQACLQTYAHSGKVQ